MSLTDLNDQGRFSHSAVCVHGQEELAYVHRRTRFHSTDRPVTYAYVSALYSTLRWQSVRKAIYLSGSVPVHGFRPVDLPGKPARYRSVPACSTQQALHRRRLRGRTRQHTDIYFCQQPVNVNIHPICTRSIEPP